MVHGSALGIGAWDRSMGGIGHEAWDRSLCLEPRIGPGAWGRSWSVQLWISKDFKECLANVIRHSGATHVTANLDATPTELVLTVTDNGKGLHSKEPGVATISPESLKRRARLLRGTVVTTDRPEGGTRITLRTKTKSWWL